MHEIICRNDKTDICCMTRAACLRGLRLLPVQNSKAFISKGSMLAD